MEQMRFQIDNRLISVIFGSFDSNIKKIENEYNVTVINRGDDIVITGEQDNLDHAAQVLKPPTRARKYLSKALIIL